MTSKQKMFCDEYLANPELNATNAYKIAYPNIKNDNVAAASASRLLKDNEDVKEYISQRLAEIHNERTADAQEVMEYLTSVMRREHKENIVVTIMQEKTEYIPDEKGTPRKHTVKTEIPQVVEIPAKLSDANKAAELLGKVHGMYTDKVELEADMELNINVDYGEE